MPSGIRSAASAIGPAATPNATAATANGTGPSSSGVGIRKMKRCSSPYASALPVAFATVADRAKNAATTLVVTATTAKPPLVDVTEASAMATADGATTRNTVSPHG